jgi:segregation and condensation protein A
VRRWVSAALSSLSRVNSVSELDLDLDVFQGPFDLLLAVVLREEISLADVALGEIVVAYIEHHEGQGRLDLDAATEFLVLIAALLELKSRLLLPGEEDDEDLGPEEAADELLARMLEYRRYRDAAIAMEKMFSAELPYIYRSAPLPAELRRAALKAAKPVYDPVRLGAALGDLLTPPPEPSTDHIRPTVSLQRRLGVLREALARGPKLDFEEAFGAEDRLTQAVTLFALLEMHWRGEATWSQKDSFGPIEVSKT